MIYVFTARDVLWRWISGSLICQGHQPKV